MINDSFCVSISCEQIVNHCVWVDFNTIAAPHLSLFSNLVKDSNVFKQWTYSDVINITCAGKVYGRIWPIAGICSHSTAHISKGGDLKYNNETHNQQKNQLGPTKTMGPRLQLMLNHNG